MLRFLQLGFITPLLIFISGYAQAYPENFRYGYQSCSSCHVSPNGGGVLTDYGKSFAEEMSTVSFEGAGRTDYGLFEKLPEEWQNWYSLGGDARYVDMQRDKFFMKFPMQREIEGALHLTRKLSLVASVGLFGPNSEKAYRKQYLLYKFNENIRVRFGKFMPAYGILWPDHTISTRRGLGFDALQETYNAEWSFTHSLGEIFVTGSMGQNFDLEGGKEHGLQARSEDERSTLVRWAMYTWGRSQIGGSYKFGRLGDDIHRVWGLFFMLAPTPSLYALGEAHYKIPERSGGVGKRSENILSYGKLGYEAYRGLHVYYAHEWTGTESLHSYGAQFFPVPHFEFNFVYQVDQLAKSWVLMSHYYL